MPFIDGRIADDDLVIGGAKNDALSLKKRREGVLQMVDDDAVNRPIAVTGFLITEGIASGEAFAFALTRVDCVVIIGNRGKLTGL